MSNFKHVPAVQFQLGEDVIEIPGHLWAASARVDRILQDQAVGLITDEQARAGVEALAEAMDVTVSQLLDVYRVSAYQVYGADPLAGLGVTH